MSDKGRRKWIRDVIDVAVAGKPDVYDASLLARASWYATQVNVLEAIASDYLAGQPIRVYGGCEDPTQFVEITHSERPLAELCEIKIPNVARPMRVHVVVDTCYPDPYFFYELIFEQMKVVDAFGGFW